MKEMPPIGVKRLYARSSKYVPAAEQHVAREKAQRSWSGGGK
jgi:hypothetical protein